MTKDFHEQRRGDVRPSSRNRSSGRYGEERSPSSARPRPNRASVDRAWESGARREHADYRPRSRDGQPPRENRRYNQNGTSAQNGRRPYNNQQNFKRFERAPNDNDDSRTQSDDAQPRHFDERRSGERGNYSDRLGPGFRENGNYRDRRPPYRGDRERDGERRDFDRDNRPPRNSTLDNRYNRDFQQPDTRNPAAVALSKLGASKGGLARAASLSERKRKAIAKKAAQARWNR